MKKLVLSFRSGLNLFFMFSLLVPNLVVFMPAKIALAASTSTKIAGTGVTSGGAGTAWVNPNNIASSGSPYATLTLDDSPGANATSETLKGTNYGFGIPSDATVNGISVAIRRQSSGIVSPFVRDSLVKLLKGGSVVGDNKAATGVDWSLNSFGVATYGGSADLWGTTWTPAEINSTNFGVALVATNPNSTHSRDGAVDYIEITVTYTPAPLDTTAPTLHLPDNMTVEATSASGANVSFSATADDETAPAHPAVSCTPASGSAFSMGTNTVTCEATDAATNKATGSFTVTVLDTTAPNTTIDSNPGTLTNSASAYFEFSANETGTFECKLDGGEFETCTSRKEYAELVEGEHDFSVRATDSYGNLDASPATFTWYIDLTAPEISAPLEKTIEATGPLTPSSLINASAEDDYDETDPSVSYDPTELPVGTNNVTVGATDAAGNEATQDVSVTVVDTTKPELTLLGNNPFDLYINNDYVEPGYSASDIADENLSENDVVVTGDDFDNTVLGAHVITYSATDAYGNTTTKTRTVHIVDRNKPIIYRIGGSPVNAEAGTAYTDLGATAIDRDGSDITSSIIIDTSAIDMFTLGSYLVTFNVTGAELGELTGTNIADQAERTVNVIDTTAPVVTILGDNPTKLRVGDNYVEAGATATDLGQDLTSEIQTSGSVDTNVAGTYTMTYSATDASGNTGSAEREVIVRELGTDSTLASLLTSMGVLVPEFNPETLNYTVLLPFGTTEEPEVSATPTDEFATLEITQATDVESANSEDRTASVVVTSEDGEHSTTYTVVFSVAPAPDTEAPIITLNGAATIELTEGDDYEEEGATAVDNIDQSVEVIISGDVDNNTPGTYQVHYNAQDSAGNHATEVIRTVIVNEVRNTTTSGSVARTTNGQVLGAEKFVFTQYLALGSTGTEVTELQKYLQSLGLYWGKIDGIFGVLTEAAVKAFQMANPPLKVDGIVGPLTREVLNK